jgi:tRNA-modifying protein YgfZ
MSAVTVATAFHARDFIDVEGPDSIKFLHAIVSQDIAGMVDDEVRWSFLLTPQGRVVSHFRVRRVTEDHLTLDVEAGFGSALESTLRRYLIRTKCTLTLKPDLVMQWSRPEPQNVESATAEILRAHPLLGGFDVLTPKGSPSGHEGFDAARIVAGLPAMGSELNESSIPNGTGLLRWAVSFTKGCYLGQELVERIDSRGGSAPARMVRLKFATQPSGADLEGSKALAVTSVAADGDAWVGLGWAARSVAIGDTIDGAQVVAEVGVDLGAV